ncbi:MAG: hypothetical protein JWM58_2608 [Rhizobium sp.]|nr:hypothetical protein [Rhizobium sp.]
MVRTKDVVLMATVSSFEGMSQPGRNELKQFSELFEPVFRASSLEARRNAVAALSRCPVLPQSVAWFLASQPIDLAAIFLTRSTAIDDDTLIAIARTQGPAHARAIAARDNLSVKVVDALVALHQGQEIGRQTPAPLEARSEADQRSSEREEQLRLQLKSLVYRDALVRSEDHPDSGDAVEQALLVRFARLRQARDFSALLSKILGSSLWLSNRIMLDLSGQQLATALIAVDTAQEDGIFILRQFYPHLGATDGETGRAALLWWDLDIEQCRDRLRMWIRADDYTQGKQPEDDTTTNANENMPAQRPAFGHARGAVRR